LHQLRLRLQNEVILVPAKSRSLRSRYGFCRQAVSLAEIEVYRLDAAVGIDEFER